jgi:hypothetical protein
LSKPLEQHFRRCRFRPRQRPSQNGVAQLDIWRAVA